MKRHPAILALGTAILALSAPAFCQEKQAGNIAAPVAIEERLGAQLPADLTFFAEDGSRVALGSVIQQPTIIALVYYECPAICGPLLNGVMSLIEDMDLEAGVDYQVLAISFDDSEGPALAARKKKNFLGELKKTIPEDAWRFFTGDQKNISAVTQAVGFHYERLETDLGVIYNHPATLIILSPDRVVTGYMRGISFLPGDVKMALNEAKAGKIRQTRAARPQGGLLSFCYAFDPEQGEKVLSITRLTGVLTVALAGVFLALVLVLRWRPKPDEGIEPAAETTESKESKE